LSDFQIVTSAEAFVVMNAPEATTSQDNFARWRDAAFRFTGITLPFLKHDDPLAEAHGHLNLFFCFMKRLGRTKFRARQDGPSHSGITTMSASTHCRRGGN
jgi:hypothetical protein